MKILLTGTIATGKSTLLDLLQERKYPNVSYVPEIARTVLKQHPEYEKRSDFQDILFNAQVKQESDSNGLVFCDRGSLDIVAHARMFGHPVKKQWVDWGKTYDKIYVLDHSDIAFDAKRDRLGLEGRDWGEYRDNLRSEIDTAIKELGGTVDIIGGTPEERTSFLESELRLWSPIHVEGRHLRGVRL